MENICTFLHKKTLQNESSTAICTNNFSDFRLGHLQALSLHKKGEKEHYPEIF